MRQADAKAAKGEQRFFEALWDIFVGAKVEGESGFISLIRIKSRYYTTNVFSKLQPFSALAAPKVLEARLAP